MKKRTVLFFGIILAGTCAFSRVWGAGEEDWKELGVESKGGTSSASEAIAKATAMNDKFEHAKQRVAAAFGGGAHPAVDVPKPAAAAEKPPVKPAAVKPVKRHPEEEATTSSYDAFGSRRSDIIRLKNGQELSGVVVTETTEKGYWVEMNGGKIFFEKDEVTEIVKGG